MPFFIGRTLVSMVTTTAFLPPGGLIFIQKHCKKKLKCLFIIVLTLMHPVFFQSKCKYTDQLFISVQFQSF